MDYENQVLHGACLDVLRELPDNTYDAVVTDPPYGLGTKEPTVEQIVSYLQGADLDTGGDFMGANWEIPSVPTWREIFRVLKPGGHVACFGGTRTWDLIALGARAAGFEFRDSVAGNFPALMWVHGQGFPKSLNIAKAIDAKLGAERQVIGEHPAPAGNSPKGGGEQWCLSCEHQWPLKNNVATACPECGSEKVQSSFDADGGGDSLNMSRVGMPDKAYITATVTEEAKKWEGYGTALKPSWEPILVFRKPMDGTVAETVMEFGTGVLNIDGTRVKHSDASDFEKHKAMVDRLKEQGGSMDGSWKNSSDLAGASEVKEGGRWPTNALMTHAPGCKQVGAKKVCVEGCPVKALEEQSGDRPSTLTGRADPTTQHDNPGDNHGNSTFGGGNSQVYADSGTASRFFPQFEGQAPPEAPFFYCPKATKKEATLEGQIDNNHPTKKPVKLMKWVCRLLCPKGGLVLDPYCGSGSTLQAAVEEGLNFTGIELDPRFVKTAQERMVIVMRVAGEDREDRDTFDAMGDIMDEFDE